MDGLRKFLPSGPNFSQLQALGGSVSFIVGLLLAVAAVIAIIAFVWNLVKTVGAVLGDNPQKRAESGKATLIALGFVLGITAGWAILINLVIDVGNKVS